MDLKKTDGEFIGRFNYFAYKEIVEEEGQQLDENTRYMVILAALAGCQGIEEYKLVLKEALERGFNPVMAKEIVYQAVAYLGIGRVRPFLDVTNEVFQVCGIMLPLEGQAVTTLDDRLEKGAQLQSEIFGEHMREAWKEGHINRWLAANCFGDYYTRKGMSLAQREIVTFCYLMAQGGCEPQLTAHAAGNINLGNDKEFLIRVVSQCLPYIGYPRSLNAIACVNKAEENVQKQKQQEQWKAEIQSLQSECGSIGKEQAKTATELAYAEVISYIDGADIDIEIKAKVIYESGKDNIIKEYIVFCKVFNEQIKEHGMTKQAVTETIRICKDRNILKQYLSSKEVEVVTIMMSLFDDEQIMRTYAKDMERETTKRNVITMIERGRIKVEEVSAFFPELTSDDVEEIERAVMQLA